MVQLRSDAAVQSAQVFYSNMATLYKGHLRPELEYCSRVWGATLAFIDSQLLQFTDTFNVSVPLSFPL